MHQQSLFKRFFAHKVMYGATIGSATFFMVIGVMLWGGFNWSMEISNTEEFCISCHEMEENVFAEYTGTAHDANRSGVKASCPDCHVPRPWIYKVIRKIEASNEIYHKLMGTVDTPEKFDAARLGMARNVWKAMKETDSRECRNCHDWETMNPEKQQPRARNQHLFAMEQGNTCIDCHKGIAHKAVHKEIEEDELEEWAKPIDAYKTEIPESFKLALARIKEADIKVHAKEQEETRKARERLKEQFIIQQAEIAAAVESAIQDYKAQLEMESGSASPEISSKGGKAEGLGMDWSGIPDHQITLFYPGQTSMEWSLVGKYHGGARPFRAGDRCMTCHDQETEDMGDKMVTGEKAEPTPIEGKRGSIPVSVQATHDGENLFMRFQWAATGHAPVSFVEGGKMDPENQVKLALMFATDEVEYASQAGCWGTCHHDARSMPNHPDDPASSGLALDFSQGVTKYIKESRTKVEEKGRRGKKLGGWDKLKDSAELKEELNEGDFMDILRVNSGDGSNEDGFILSERVMKGGQGFESAIFEKGGIWTVEIKRKLKSDKTGDISFKPGEMVNFGFAIHDDYSNARFHHVSLGYKLALDNPDAEINAVSQ